MADASVEQPGETRHAEIVLDRRLILACHAIRIAAVAWIAWAAYAVIVVWGNPAKLVNTYSRLLKLDLSGYATSQYLGSLAVVLVDLTMSALVALSIWRLFGHFLAGRILDAGTADTMRRLGWIGLVALLVDLAARPATAAILSAHIDHTQPRIDVWGQPNDLLHIMMALFIVVLASVLRTGVAIADEHRQIV